MAGYILYSLDWNKFQKLIGQPTPEQLTELSALLDEGLEEFTDEFDDDDPVAEWPRDPKSLASLVAQRLALPDWYGDLSTTGKALWETVIYNACMDEEDAFDLDLRVENDGINWDVIELVWKRLKVAPNSITDVAASGFGARPYRYVPRLAAETSSEEIDADQDEDRASLLAMRGLLEQFAKDATAGKKEPTTLLEEMEKDDALTERHKMALEGLLSEDEDNEEDMEGDFGSEDWQPMHSMHTPEQVRNMLAELRSVGAAVKKSKTKGVREQYTDALLPAVENVAAQGRMLFVQLDT